MPPHLKAFLEPGRLEAGCDEAGRGPLAGPVYAAAVILPPDFFHPLLNDSKQMSEKQREELRPIIEREAMAWAVEAVQPEEIDQLNILWASVTGMQRAVLRLQPQPEFLLIDGNKFRPFDRLASRTTRPSYTGTPPMPASPRHRSWPRRTGTHGCGNWPWNTPSTAGTAIWAILHRNT